MWHRPPALELQIVGNWQAAALERLTDDPLGVAILLRGSRVIHTAQVPPPSSERLGEIGELSNLRQAQRKIQILRTLILLSISAKLYDNFSAHHHGWLRERPAAAAEQF